MISRACSVIYIVASGALAVVSTAAYGGESMAMSITSPAFQHGGDIPSRYTCQGEDISPQLTFAGVPAASKSLLLIVDDPDAPDPAAPSMIWVHWLLYNLPPDTQGLAEAVKALPAGTLQGNNSWQRTGYGGPCPPIGRHRYFFRLYALDTQLTGLAEPDRTALLAAMQGHVLAEATLLAYYRKH